MSFAVYERRAYVTLRIGAQLYDNSALSGTPVVTIDPDRRELVYVGTVTDAVRIVAYEAPGAPDSNSSSRALYVSKSGLVQDGAGNVVLRFVDDASPDTTPFDQADIDAAVAPLALRIADLQDSVDELLASRADQARALSDTKDALAQAQADLASAVVAERERLALAVGQAEAEKVRNS